MPVYVVCPPSVKNFGGATRWVGTHSPLVMAIPYGSVDDYAPFVSHFGASVLPLYKDCPITLAIAKNAHRNGYEKVCVVDHTADVRRRYRKRKPVPKTAYAKLSRRDVDSLFRRLEDDLDSVGIVGIGDRFSSRWEPKSRTSNYRPSRGVVAYDVSLLLGCKHGRVGTYDCYDIALTLLKARHENHVYFQYVDFAQYAAPTQRELSRLHALHPDVVSVHDNGQYRIGWKRAYRADA